MPSVDFDRTAEFYDQCGFHLVRNFDGRYLILRNPAGIELHFFPHPDLDPTHNDHGAYVRFDSDIEAESLYNQWLAAGVADGELHPPQATDYGLLEFALLDPDRNLLRVGGVIPD